MEFGMGSVSLWMWLQIFCRRNFLC